MFWDTLRSDLQHTLRLAAKTPLVTALTIVALALGIGATQRHLRRRGQRAGQAAAIRATATGW